MGEGGGGPSDGPGGALAARLAAARARAFVGRREELGLFRSALEADTPPFAVLHVHGPGGVGKTSLLRRFAGEARDVGRDPVVVDGREVEPSPSGFLAALGAALGAGPDGALAAIGRVARPILLVDTYELLGPIDGWIRETLLPGLPERALVVLAGRRPPAAGWRSDPAWNELLRTVGLENLPSDDARALLRGRDVPEAMLDEMVGLTHGHPLALMLVSDLVDGDVALPALDEAPEVIDALLGRFLRRIPSDRHRRGLHAAAQARIATEGLIRDTVDREAAPEIFEWLRRLSFTEPVAGGVAVHDLVTDALNAELRWRDPEGWADLHGAITRHLEGRIGRAAGVDRMRAMLDFLQLYRLNPLTSRFFDWERTEEFWLESATVGDHEDIVALTREYEGEESAALVRHWLARQPEAFTAFRRHDRDSLAGFICNLLLGDDLREEAEADPAIAAVWRHVRRTAPLRRGEHVRVMRFWVARGSYQDIVSHHLVSARTTVDWLETERLAWSFAVVSEADFYEPLFRFIDFTRLPHPALELGDRAWGIFARDFRRISRRRWRELLLERRVASPDQELEAPREGERLMVLDEEEFTEAVKDALRGLARPGGLEDSPLLRSRVVADAADGGSREQALITLLREAADELGEHPRDESKRRTLELTYFSPAPTQEAAAERLDLPFSTFRRHLKAGIDHVASRLWERELHG